MKNSDQKPFDQVLKDRLAEGTEPVPAFVWDRIEEELFPRKKRRPFFWWFFSGAGIGLIGLFLGLAFSGSRGLSQHTLAAQDKDSGTPATVQPGSKNSIVASQDQVLRENNSSVTASEKKVPESNSSRSNPETANQGAARRFSRLSAKNSAAVAAAKSGPRQPLQASDTDLSANSTCNISVAPENKPAAELPGMQAGKSGDQNENGKAPATLSYEEIAALLTRDFGLPEGPVKPAPASRFSIGVYGGPSLYQAAVFKDYFTSGQLSKRTFASSGFELGLQANWKVGNRFRVYAGLAFNQKQTQFSYNVAITQADYFTYLANGEAVPLANIRDDGSASCFLAKDVTVRYRMQSALISVGTSFQFLEIGKFTIAADIRLSGNVRSSLDLQQVRVLNIEQPASETFSYLQPAAGLSLGYRLNDRISLGLAPSFSKQFYLKTAASRKLEELVIPLTVSFDF